jgi:uncharacterized integral membrane protein
LTGPTEPLSEPGRQVRARSRTRDVRMVLMGVATVLLVWFAVANLQDVTIHFWVSTTKAPLIGVIVIAGALGGLLLSAVTLRRRPPRRSGRRGGQPEE